MPARKPLSSALPPNAAAFVRGDALSDLGAQISAELLDALKAAPKPEARVRFTVDLPKSLHKRLKLAALHRDEAMTDLARKVLTEWLDSQA